MKRTIQIIAIVFLVAAFGVQSADAGFLYHATKRAAAERIAKNGFSKAFMNPKARFGAKAYASNRPSTALRERPGSDSVLRFRTPKNFNNHLMDTRKMRTADMKNASGLKDMRGEVKKGVVGPKLGKSLGRNAAKNNTIIAYRSAKNTHATNYAIPEGVYRNTRIMKPDKIIRVN